MDCWQSSPTRICTAWVFLLLLDIIFDVSDSASQAEVDKHLEMGRDFLSRGQLQDALSHYHAAVEGDPTNYLTYFKRGTVYLALGKSKSAITDLDKVLEYKPDFIAARLQRGQVYLKQALLDNALTDFHQVLHEDPHNMVAYSSFEKIEPVREDIALAHAYARGGDYHSAIELISRVIEVCPWSSALRELRADCHVALGDTMSAISDIRTTTKLQSDNTAGHYKLATLHYQLGEAEESLREIRECLKLDPEHKDCFPHYKKVKLIQKQLENAQDALNEKDFQYCIDSANKVLSKEASVNGIRFQAYDKLCQCYQHNGQITLSLQACRDALEIQKDPRVYCDRAEAYIADDMFDDAIRDYHEALEIDEHYQRAKDGLQKAQKLQKQSERRDYYKILNVKRTADKKEIVKAYRKAAQEWHPDNFPDEDEKKKAEKKFIDIAAAKEVLTDPEKRQKFDNGEDPLDPESGQHANGFHPGFQHFQHGGSPFQFKFHFN